MKNIVLLVLLIFNGLYCFAQWSESEIKPYRNKAEEDIRAYKARMIESAKWDAEYDALKIEFTLDTMYIERIVHWLGEDGRYSTVDMHQTVSLQITEYDRLLNKYYRMLMSKLSEEDKTRLRDAQRTWLKYRDSEAEINSKIVAPNQYAGSGTMWPLIASGRNLEIIKERVLSLYALLTYI